MPLSTRNNLATLVVGSVAVALVVLCGAAVPLRLLSSIFEELDRLVGYADASFRPPIATTSANEDDAALRPCDAIQGGGIVARILRGEQPFPTNCSRREEAPAGLRFRPGTLPLTSAETLQHCFVNATRYRHHGRRYGDVSRVAVSDDYRFAYVLVPKSASSTSRHYVQQYFNGTELMVKHSVLMDTDYLSLVSFVREPLNRFYSSYHEAYWRKLPFQSNHEVMDDRYAYIYDNMTKAAWATCYNAVRRQQNPQLCEGVDESPLRNFERFVAEYDGIQPWDVHFMLQTLCFTDGSGTVLPMANLYDATDAEAGWRDVATRVGATAFLNKGKEERDRANSRTLFNASSVSTATQRKICQLMALDYCCLNLKLPEVCRGAIGGEEDSVFCTVERNTENETKIHHWAERTNIGVTRMGNEPRTIHGDNGGDAPAQNRTIHNRPDTVATLPIHLLDPSAGTSAVLSWEALAANWDRDATFEHIANTSQSAPLPALPLNHRIAIIIHCAPKMGSATLRTACRDTLETTCGVDTDRKVDPKGYNDPGELADLVRECNETHHFCQRRGLLKESTPPITGVTFLHLYPFRNYDEWTTSALKQPFDRDGERGCDHLRTLMDDCEDNHGELSFWKYPKTQMSDALPVAMQRINERREGHYVALYPFREIHSLLEMLSDEYRIPMMVGSNGTEHAHRPRNGTCNTAILDRFHECFTAGLTKLP
ncbi:hypothetical protein ACHAXT_008455 [Thalassiosira profunda]